MHASTCASLSLCLSCARCSLADDVKLWGTTARLHEWLRVCAECESEVTFRRMRVVLDHRFKGAGAYALSADEFSDDRISLTVAQSRDGRGEAGPVLYFASLSQFLHSAQPLAGTFDIRIPACIVAFQHPLAVRLVCRHCRKPAEMDTGESSLARCAGSPPCCAAELVLRDRDHDRDREEAQVREDGEASSRAAAGGAAKLPHPAPSSPSSSTSSPLSPAAKRQRVAGRQQYARLRAAVARARRGDVPRDYQGFHYALWPQPVVTLRDGPQVLDKRCEIEALVVAPSEITFSLPPALLREPGVGEDIVAAFTDARNAPLAVSLRCTTRLDPTGAFVADLTAELLRVDFA
jgi:hypothetical protein